MRVIITKDYEAMSKKAAQIVAKAIRKKPNLVLGLATGSTPLGLYRELIRLHKEEGLNFSQVVTFNLDEYYGLSPRHEQSYHYFMYKNLFDHINISPQNVHIPDGMVALDDVESYCEEYERMIAECGGIDLQVLGIGGDGHVGFNEPGSSLGSRTRLKTLDAQTIKDNARFFTDENEVPRFAITMGVASILDAKRCLLLANGENKAEVLAKAVEGPITAQITASALQMHPDVIVICDEEAGSKLSRREYYNHVERVAEELEKKLGAI